VISAAITIFVASERVFIFVVVYFVLDSVRKLLDTPSYIVQAYFKEKCHVSKFHTHVSGLSP
jgi:hypothetical protein